MTNDLISGARLEVRRCQRSMDGGGSADFWLRRLERAAKKHEASAAILRMQIAAMGFAARPVRDCTCFVGACRGADGLAPGWRCVKETLESAGKGAA